MEKEKNIDYYSTIIDSKRAEIKIKGSKFIATAFPAPTRELALESLEKMRSEFFDATHNCYAWQIGWDGSEFRAADDGEPSGSAGKPILFSIKKFDVSDVIVIVTRYFGGTKLGVGGLVRAYSDATEEVMALCEKKTIHRTLPVKISCGYQDVSTVKKLVSELAVSFQEEYTDGVEIIANIHLSKAEGFCTKLFNISSSRIKPYIMEKT